MDDRELARRVEDRGLGPYERLASMDSTDPELQAWHSHVRDDFVTRMARRASARPPRLWPFVWRHTYGDRPIGPLWFVNVLVVLATIPLVVALFIPPLFL